MRPAIFVDRDGVINDLVPDPISGLPESPLRTRDAVLLPGVADAIEALQAAGFPVIVVSNQPAAAKGVVSEQDLNDVHARVVELLAGQGVVIDDWRYCRHRAEDDCPCRKPRPGLVLAAAREHDIDLPRSWLIGDTDADLGASQAAGTRFLLVEHPGSAHKRQGRARGATVVPDLPSAAAHILRAVDRARLRGHDRADPNEGLR